MEHHLVIGTAGHIDHGKTTLVKALTGVDTDRLAEEKSRGITIDLGFAPLALDGVRASIVDVPGHEGFIRNMVAGATGVDLALLVVAADEGVMPQTREHVAILHHLGVRRGVVALTKTDLAPEADWQVLVGDDIRSLLRSQIGIEWPVVPVSGTSGAGLAGLRAALLEAAAGVVPRPGDDLFRMPVDRVFSLPGAGTIVTGTVWSGLVREGDSVTVLPAGSEVRVRSVQVHGAAAAAAAPGRRAALALVGLERSRAERGAVVVSGTGWRASRVIDVVARLAPGVELKLRSRLRVHHGTAELMGRLARFGDAEGALRLVLDGVIVARAGDRLVLRSFSPVTTIGGGVITDPWAERQPGRRRREAPAGMAAGDAALLATLVRRRGPGGLTAIELGVVAGLPVSRRTAALADAGDLGIVAHEGWYVAATEVAGAMDRMREALRAFHVANPIEPGMNAQAWRDAGSAHAPLAALAEARLLSSGAAARSGGVVHQPDWKPGTTGAAQAASERVLESLRLADAEPPSAAELAALHPDVDVKGVLRALQRSGRVVLVGERYYEVEALGRERDRLVAAFQIAGVATPAQVRERLGRSRKWLIPLLEWADREGLTTRNGDRRTLRNGMGA